MNLILNGHVADGCGRFALAIGLPSDLLKDDPDWIKTFIQGTLNVQLDTKSIPFLELDEGLWSLDSNANYPPHIYRDGREIKNNTIQPTNDHPIKGDLQLWRANMLNTRLGTSHNCYLIRRVGSGYREIAEILGMFHFRDECNFMTDDPIKVEVFFPKY